MINHTVNTEVRDIRRIPVVIPDEESKKDIESNVNKIIQIRKGEVSGDIQKYKSKIDQTIESLYEVESLL